VERARAQVEIVRVAPEFLDVVAQIVWVAAPGREVAVAEADGAGLLPVLVDAPLSQREAEAVQAGIDALLREPSVRSRGAYWREVRDAAGTRRELAVPAAPEDWRGEATMVGPFEDEAAAQRWRETLPPPLVGDVSVHLGRWYVDVFSGDDGG
jgi:hypothetical protein